MFEDVLIESSSRKAGNKTALTLPVSIAIHAVVIGLIAKLGEEDDRGRASYRPHTRRPERRIAASRWRRGGVRKGRAQD